MKLKSENFKSWVGTLVFHLILALVLFLWKINSSAGEQDFIEVNVGSVSNIRTSTPPRAGIAGSEGSALKSISPAKRTVQLPERVFSGPDEILPVPRTKKMDAEEQPLQQRTQYASSGRGTKDRGAGFGMGSKEKALTPGAGEFAGDVAGPRATGISGSDVGSSVSVSMQWSDGGTRQKISGDLPEYPKGVNVEAQIKIETVVMPDGSVRGLKPAQKGNTRLEEAAMSAVRLWKFEPLRKSSPQKDQTCVVTFNFLLR